MCDGRRHSRMWRTGAVLPCVRPSSHQTATPPIRYLIPHRTVFKSISQDQKFGSSLYGPYKPAQEDKSIKHMPCELFFCRQLSSLLNRVSQTQTPNTLSQVPQPPVLSTLAAHTHTQMVARLARHTQTHHSPKTGSSSIHVLYRPSGRLGILQEPRKSPACLTPCTKGGRG